MTQLNLTRYTHSGIITLGRLTYEDNHWYTVERPWLDNAPNISCIPTGVYPMRRFYDVHGYRSSKAITQDYVWEICEVPDRTVILVHVANYPRNVKGCVGLGTSTMANFEGVGSSVDAIKEFYNVTSHETEMEIIIRDGAIYG